MKNANYSVDITLASGGTWWAQTNYAVLNKTVNGFTIMAYNTGEGVSENLVVNYIAIPYTE